MFAILGTLALSIYNTWVAYRAWRTGVITIRLSTDRRDDDEWQFMTSLKLWIFFTTACWALVGVMLYKQINSN